MLLPCWHVSRYFRILISVRNLRYLEFTASKTTDSESSLLCTNLREQKCKLCIPAPVSAQIGGSLIMEVKTDSINQVPRNACMLLSKSFKQMLLPCWHVSRYFRILISVRNLRYLEFTASKTTGSVLCTSPTEQNHLRIISKTFEDQSDGTLMAKLHSISETNLVCPAPILCSQGCHDETGKRTLYIGGWSPSTRANSAGLKC